MVGSALSSLLAGGETFLETREHELRWWQLALLDVYCVIALAALVGLGFVGSMGWLCYRAVMAALRLRTAKGKQH